MCPSNACGYGGFRDIIIHKNDINPNILTTLSYYDLLEKEFDGNSCQYITIYQTQLPIKLHTTVNDTDLYYAFNGSHELYNMLKEKTLFVDYSSNLLHGDFISDFIIP
jgi:hypothetical protein